MSGFITVPTDKLIKLCEKFFEKENKRVAESNKIYRKALYTKRRFFGLLKPKFSKEEVESWFTPTIYDSMAFQTMFPHHKIAELLFSAELAKVEGIESILVESKIFNHLDGNKVSWG